MGHFYGISAFWGDFHYLHCLCLGLWCMVLGKLPWACLILFMIPFISFGVDVGCMSADACFRSLMDTLDSEIEYTGSEEPS